MVSDSSDAMARVVKLERLVGPAQLVEDGAHLDKRLGAAGCRASAVSKHFAALSSSPASASDWPSARRVHDAVFRVAFRRAIFIFGNNGDGRNFLGCGARGGQFPDDGLLQRVHQLRRKARIGGV